MTEPVLYQRYDRAAAIALFGPSWQARETNQGHWVFFPKKSVCLATVGDGASHFQNAARFVWVNGSRYRGVDPTGFVPKAVQGGKRTVNPIYLFATNASSPQYRYLGQLGPTFAMGHSSASDPGHADFTLSPPLPSAIMKELTGFHPGDLNHARVDAALARLHGQTSWQERFEVLQILVEYFYGPIGTRDGFSEAELEGMQMPAALHRWYQWAGKRKEIMTGQDILLSPRHDDGKSYGGLYVEDAKLVFHHENQCVYRWATLEEGEDPPVFGKYDGPWEQEAVTITEHLIMACLLDAVMGRCKYVANHQCLENERAREIIAQIPLLPLGPWRWCGPTRFYAGKGAFMFAMTNGDDALSIWIGAKTEHPLQALKPYLDETWENEGF